MGDVAAIRKQFIETLNVKADNMKQLFEQFDVDKDGSIQPDEFTSVNRKLGHKVTDEDALKLFKAADDNNDGMLSFEEFSAFLKC